MLLEALKLSDVHFFCPKVCLTLLQYFSRDSVTLLIEREDLHSLGWFFVLFSVVLDTLCSEFDLAILFLSV